MREQAFTQQQLQLQQMQVIIDLANSLHINSFTYDFHLRHFLSYVTVRSHLPVVCYVGGAFDPVVLLASQDPLAQYPSLNFIDTVIAFTK